MGKPSARVDESQCLSCGGCVSVCPQEAIVLRNLKAVIDKEKCTACEICIKTCPIGAIHLERM